CQQRNSHPRTF
nr:immunoglobulin light chain junction region [Macaca mulatta]